MIALLLGLTVNAFAVRINGTRIQKYSNVAGVIRDAVTGKGISGVPVSDGYTFTVSDRNGVYQMHADSRCRTIFYSTPSEYAVAQAPDGSPAFWQYRDSGAVLDRKDFILKRIGHAEDNLTLVMLADPQCQSFHDVARLRKETIPDVQKALEEGISKGEYSNVFAFGLGDIIYDNLDIWEPMAESFRSIKLQDRNVPIFNIPGNHDHSNLEHDDYDCLSNYVMHFGPTDYSFNIGNIHFICMDNIIYTSSQKLKPGKFVNCLYDSGFTDEQMEWLRKDIGLVKDKDAKTVIFCTHAPFRKGAEKGGGDVNFDKHYSDVLSILTSFREAHLMIGHTHHPSHEIHSEYVCKGGRPVYEHIHHAICGAWWHADICVDGTPNGYAIYQFRNGTLDNYVARYTGEDPAVQMRVYDGNQVYSGHKGYVFPWESKFKDCLIATVWNDDAFSWKVELIASDGTVYPMTRVTESQRDWCCYSFFLNENGRDPKNTSYAVDKLHYWYVKAPCGNPAEEKGWTIRAIQTIPTSGKVNVYTCSTLQTSYSGLEEKD